MRPLLPLALLLASAAALAQPPQPPTGGPGEGPREHRWGGGFHHPHGSVFLSPMGEPFRSEDPNADNVGTWFAQADRNHDGAITLDEMQADANRFFDTLDSNHDGEIDPEEINRYETEIAPEVQVGTQMGERSFGRRGGEGGGRGGGGGWGGGRHGGGGRRGGGPEGGATGGQTGQFEEGLEGAGRFSFLNIPEPVISADTDFNRGVSRAEFLAAAGKRFLMLDARHDGRITRDELPPLPQRHSGKRKHKGPIAKPEREALPLD